MVRCIECQEDMLENKMWFSEDIAVCLNCGSAYALSYSKNLSKPTITFIIVPNFTYLISST